MDNIRIAYTCILINWPGLKGCARNQNFRTKLFRECFADSDGSSPEINSHSASCLRQTVSTQSYCLFVFIMNWWFHNNMFVTQGLKGFYSRDSGFYYKRVQEGCMIFIRKRSGNVGSGPHSRSWSLNTVRLVPYPDHLVCSE